MALTKRYVRSDAAGGGDGTTNTNSGANGAFTWAEMITDINTPRVGYKYLVKSGMYSRITLSDTFTGDGNTTSPNVIEGFNSTEGDLLANGRDTNGALVTTNFPEITYTSGRFSAAGSNYLVIQCLNVSGDARAGYVMGVGSYCLLRRCKVTNSATNIASTAIETYGSYTDIMDCDLFQTSATGGAAAVDLDAFRGTVIGCRIKSTSGPGILVPSYQSSVLGCLIYESGVGIKPTYAGESANLIVNNTIVNCSGSGIVVSGLTGLIRITGNHITGNGGWGLDWGGVTSNKIHGHNRFRDNSSGAISGGGDWEEGTSLFNDTSDPGGGSKAANDLLEYYDPTNKNFALKTTSSAIVAGIGYRNAIGAHGAGAFPTGGGLLRHPGMNGGANG